MWICKVCNTEIVEDDFEVCWNCGADQLGKTSSSIEPEKKCLSCSGELIFVGEKTFHEGTRWGAMGDLAELFVNKESLNMYACKQCGKVEFYMLKK